MALQRITHKKGDTFQPELSHSDSSNAPIDLSGYTISSQLRNGITSALIATFTVTILPQTGATLGRFQLFKEYTGVSDATDTWPLGIHKMDIQFTIGATRYTTPTFEVEVTADVTT